MISITFQNRTIPCNASAQQVIEAWGSPQVADDDLAVWWDFTDPQIQVEMNPRSNLSEQMMVFDPRVELFGQAWIGQDQERVLDFFIRIFGTDPEIQLSHWRDQGDDCLDFPRQGLELWFAKTHLEFFRIYPPESAGGEQ